VDRVRIALAGPGAFGTRHLQALCRIEGVEVVSIVGETSDAARDAASKFDVAHWTSNLAESLARPEVDAVILATPTPLHAAQSAQCMRAGKHVLVEIPMADSLADAQNLVRLQQATGVTAMVGHVRRFNPSHQWLRRRMAAGELKLQQLSVQTYFFRRTNLNALGQARNWTDHLLWHHACHTVDLFQYQTGELASRAFALQGPPHPALGIAMDMAIGLKAPSGALCTLSLSFNNDGPLGTWFRYICDNGTYVASYDDLFDGKQQPIDVSSIGLSKDGVELQDLEFVAAIREGREPNASLAQALPTMETLDRLERSLRAND
jgi:2-hydroxy-4-carboxymuconate semialdehyde hemiacetal dehydrogenase